jgi:hypothetical protein
MLVLPLKGGIDMKKSSCSCGKELKNGACPSPFCVNGEQGKELSKEQLKEILKLIEK